MVRRHQRVDGTELRRQQRRRTLPDETNPQAEEHALQGRGPGPRNLRKQGVCRFGADTFQRQKLFAREPVQVRHRADDRLARLHRLAVFEFLVICRLPKQLHHHGFA